MKKTPVDDVKIEPINYSSIVPFVEQLNGLIDRYNAIYSIYNKPLLCADRLIKVLVSLEKAIEALCLRICEDHFIFLANQSAT